MHVHTSHHRRGAGRLVAATVIAGLVFAVCGNSGDDNSAADTAAPTTTAAATATTAPATTAPTTEATPTTPTTPTGSTPETTEATAETTTPPTTEPAIDLGEFQPISGVNGVTDDQIGFGLVSTGPSNPLGYCLMQCYQDGIDAYFKYRNELGGIHGRQLALTQALDDEVGSNQVKTLELIGDSDVFGVFYAPIIYAGLPDLHSNGVPTYTVFPASPESNGLENTYVPSGTLCLTCPRPLDVEVAKLAGATKVAALGLSVSQASIDCVAAKKQAFEQWGPAVGIEFVYENADLAYGLPNGVAPEVTAMKDAGVDFILNCVDQNSALTIEQEMERQGMGDVHMVLPQGYGDTEFISTNADLLEGDYLPTQFRPLEANPGDTMMTTMLQYLDGLTLVNDYTVQGWVDADLAVRGLLAAGPQFDRPSVISATNEITDWTAGGLLPPVDWSKQHTAPTVDDPVSNAGPYDCSAFLKVTGGKLEVTGSADDPFVCFTPPVTDWVEPTAMSFK